MMGKRCVGQKQVCSFSVRAAVNGGFASLQLVSEGDALCIALHIS